jgi:CheY-like chemotaxis protein
MDTLTAGSEQLHVLAVDDYPANLTVLAALLEPEGLCVINADSAGRALELCRDRSFSAILLDIRLRDADGRQTAKEIRKSTMNQDTPILFLTGDPETADSVRRQGWPVLLKPYKADALVNAVRELLAAPERRMG